MTSTQPPPSTGAHTESFELTTLWEVVRDCRSRVTKSFGYLDPALCDALGVAVSELTENVIKYAALESEQRPSVTVRVTTSHISVRSQNSARSEYDARLACSLIAKVAAEIAQRDPEVAYAEAIELALSHKQAHSRQGFYRIAAVGGFQLRAEREGKLLTITGERTR